MIYLIPTEYFRQQPVNEEGINLMLYSLMQLAMKIVISGQGQEDDSEGHALLEFPAARQIHRPLQAENKARN